MNPIHVHLIFNHFPILGTLFGIFVLVYGSLKKSDEICRLALWTFVLSSLSAVPVYFTGEKAEHLVQPMLNLSEAFIERHEEAGELGFVLACVLGLLSGWGLFRYRSARLNDRFLTVCMILALACGAALVRAGGYGGILRHSEIQADWKDYKP
jgi:uncharacterized membrane protein